jgi:hypothetical protein
MREKSQRRFEFVTRPKRKEKEGKKANYKKQKAKKHKVGVTKKELIFPTWRSGKAWMLWISLKHVM